MKKRKTAADWLAIIIQTIGGIIVSSPLIIMLLALVDAALAIGVSLLCDFSNDEFFHFVIAVDILIFCFLLYLSYSEAKGED